MSISRSFRLAVGCFAAAVVACAQTGAPAAAPPKSAAPAKPAAPPKPVLEPGLYATITTSMGPIVVKLYEKESPITVKNFMDLAMGRKAWTDPKTNKRVKRPLYNGLTFHRVIPNFMIQGGDPMGNGMGGTDTIPDEFAPSLTFDRPGRVAMANAGPQTGSSQFFITDAPTPHLNGRHTIFGQVVDGQDVEQKIARVPRDEENDKPKTPVRIVRITFKRVGPGPQPGVAPAKSSTSKPRASKPKPATSKPAAQSSGTSK
jgi:peptidyl-prolyl cis-trans isomerase A (cyclophilin A)